MRAQESEENTFALIGLSNNSGVVWGSPLPDGRVKFCADGEGLACWGGVWCGRGRSRPSAEWNPPVRKCVRMGHPAKGLSKGRR